MSKYPGRIITDLAPAGYSVFFDGTGDYLNVASNTALTFGTGDFTVEGWFYANALGGQPTILNNGSDAAGKAMGYLQTKGKNLTTKVTADKLNSAWQKAGSPTDSEELKKFLGSQGVAADVIDSVYKTLKIAPEKAATGAVDIEQVKQMISKLPTDRKARLLKFLTKASTGAEPAAEKKPNRDAGDGRIEPTMA